MNMPCMTKTTYRKHLENIMGVLEEEAKGEMQQAGQRLRRKISGENLESTDDLLDVAVSFETSVHDSKSNRVA